MTWHHSALPAPGTTLLVYDVWNERVESSLLTNRRFIRFLD